MLTIVFRCYLGLHVPEGLGKAASTITGPNDFIRVVWVVYLFIYYYTIKSRDASASRALVLIEYLIN